MLFNSDIFIFVFLPLVLTGFYLIGRTGQRRVAAAWLVGASLVFYGWWNPIFLLLILSSVVVNYSLGLLLAKRARRTALAAGIAFNLGLLGYFKYANFLVDSLNTVAATGFVLPPIVLPLAISFFTFQQIAFLVDAYRGEAQEYDYVHYCLFVTFFPQLIAGPIVHHKEMMPQFSRRETYRFDAERLAVGLAIFVIGLIKKVALADRAARYASPVFAAAEEGQAIGFLAAWLGALAYSCQIYFDFSGYSDMAIGLARMLGIRLPINFNSPYKARSIIDFWRRWHITLSRFLRDYLYFPLGGNRKGSARRYFNVFAVMVLGGLWHGAGWTFVLWGGLHGLYLVVNHGWRALVGAVQGDAPRRRVWAGPASWVLTGVAVMVGWVVFRAESLAGAMAILSGMAGANGVPLPDWLAQAPAIGSLVSTSAVAPLDRGDLKGFVLVAAMLGVAFSCPNTQQIMRRFMTGFDYSIEPMAPWAQRLRWRPDARVAALMALATVIAVASLWSTSEFLYFQF